MPPASGEVNTAGCDGALLTLKAMEYVCEKRAGQRATTSSLEVADAERVYGSKARLPAFCAGAPSVATTGLLPHSSEVKVASEGAERLPSLSTTTTDAVQVPADLSTPKLGAATVAEFSRAALPAGDCRVQA